MSNWNIKFDLVVNKILLDTPKDENILSWTMFTWKYPTVNFFQTMMLILATVTDESYMGEDFI